MRRTLSPGVELMSPPTITEGLHSNLSDTRILNWANRAKRYLACASFTSAQFGSLKQQHFRTSVYGLEMWLVCAKIQKELSQIIKSSTTHRRIISKVNKQGMWLVCALQITMDK